MSNYIRRFSKATLIACSDVSDWRYSVISSAIPPLLDAPLEIKIGLEGSSLKVCIRPIEAIAAPTESDAGPALHGPLIEIPKSDE